MPVNILQMFNLVNEIIKDNKATVALQMSQSIFTLAN